MAKRVLVVEDNDVARTVMQRQLAALGVNCYAVNNGEEAVELAEFFDLILMDIQLAGISGVEATAKIRKRESDKGTDQVPIVAVTAEHNREECLAAGMNDFFPKPIRLQDISVILHKWVLNRRPKLRMLG